MAVNTTIFHGGYKMELETYECTGCGGDISVLEAIWLPEKTCKKFAPDISNPFCSKECFEINGRTHDDLPWRTHEP
jgi:hypothetical protein